MSPLNRLFHVDLIIVTKTIYKLKYRVHNSGVDQHVCVRQKNIHVYNTLCSGRDSQCSDSFDHFSSSNDQFSYPSRYCIANIQQLLNLLLDLDLDQLIHALTPRHKLSHEVVCCND